MRGVERTRTGCGCDAMRCDAGRHLPVQLQLQLQLGSLPLPCAWHKSACNMQVVQSADGRWEVFPTELEFILCMMDELSWRGPAVTSERPRLTRP